MEFPAFGDLDHVVVVVESGKKAVSSSEAHTRVLTSPLFVNRPTRAEARLANLIAAFRDSDWKSAFELVWSEFQDMHSLFETAQPTFGYFEPGTHVVLEKLRSLWDETDDGPLVTMDAGANVHLMFRPDQSALRESLVGLWSKDYRCLSSSSTGLQG